MSELAIAQFQVQLITGREHKNNTKNPPTHDPQENGEAEWSVQEVLAQLRAVT